MGELLEFFKNTNVVAGLIGAAIAWVISQSKVLREISKLRNEAINIEVGLYKELNVLENYSRDKSKEIDEVLKAILANINQKNSNELSANWDKLSYLFFFDYVTCYSQYVRTAKKLFSNDRERLLEFIDDDVFSFMRLAQSILTVMNQPNVLEMNNNRKFKTTENTFKFAFRVVKRTIRFYDFKRKKKLENYENSLKQFQK